MVVVGTAALGGAVWLAGGSPGGRDRGGHDAGHRDRAGQATVERRVGAPQFARLAGGAGGRVRLSVTAEVPAERAPSRLASVPAGASVTLSFGLPRRVGGRSKPRLVAHRLERSVGGGASGRAGHAAHGGAGVRLSSEETFLFNRRSGQVIVPGAAGGAPGQHHEPGQELAQSVAGGGWSFTTKLPPRAGETAVDPTGRFLAVAYPQAGRIELLDLLRHRRAGAIDAVARPGALRFAPGGDRLWATDESRGRVVVVDVASRRAVGEVPTGSGRRAVAFAGRDTAVVTSEADGRATIVDARRVAVLGTVAVPRPVDAAFARAAGAFAVAGRDGSIALIGARSGPGRVERTLRVGPGADVRALGVAPDGRTAVALDAARDQLAVVDLRSGRLRQRVDAGADPSSVVFLGRFAIVRNAGSADLTWVDLKDPSKSNNLPLGSHPAAAIALSSDGASVQATMPREQQVATLHVMMGRPMVMDGMRNTIRADVVAAVANDLQSIGPKTLEQRTVFERPGRYHLELRLPDGARAEFELPVTRTGPRQARVLAEQRQMRAAPGEPVRVRFRVIGPTPTDAQVLALSTSAGAIHQLRAPARPVGTGVFEALITPPAAGSYRLSLQSESQDLATDGSSGAALRVTGAARDRGG
ncbi:MAG TPA: hypothetical protein VHF51_08615 [Solirubrobacteraceae bacterium]|nr:hypothetical protein [Solirubrobacteraceae bacterium]